MKKLFFVLALLSASSAFASFRQFNIDEVDTVSLEKKSVLVEDLRDGFDSIDGVRVSEDFLEIDTNSEVEIILKSGLNVSAKASKMGGDMGGG